MACRTDTLPHFLTDVANAIRTKAGTSGTIQASEFDTAISNIPGGGTVIPTKKDVNFYDYDGTLVNSYTKQEFLALTSMPSNPTHSGLTAQGWNWTLAQAKTYVTNYNQLNIGQMYVTDDNKTRIYIHAYEYRTTITLGVSLWGDDTATVNWGDNTTSEIQGLGYSAVVYGQHTYSQEGDYVITINSLRSGGYGLEGISGTGSMIICKDGTTTSSHNRLYQTMIEKIELSDKCSINSYAFQYCYNLKSITIPHGKTMLGTYAFANCYSLSCVVLPDTITGIDSYCFSQSYNLKTVIFGKGNLNTLSQYTFNNCYELQEIFLPDSLSNSGANAQYFFNNCYSLKKVVIPNNVTGFATYFFYNCQSLKNLDIPTSANAIAANCFYGAFTLVGLKLPRTIVTIGNTAFRNCYGLKYLDFSQYTSVPTSIGTNLFTNVPSDFKIIVPDSLYTTWIGSSAWSNYTSYIIKKSEWDAL